MTTPQICQWQPPPGSNSGGSCQFCGHSVAVHVGVTQCPVCYLIALGAAMHAAVRSFAEHLRRTADGIRDQSWPNT